MAPRRSDEVTAPRPSLALLDGLRPGVIADAAQAALGADGVLRSVHRLGSETFAPCRGCWQCWVAKPGTCKATDASNEVMRDVIGADAVLWTTEVKFGCWGSVTKAALDKSIGLLSPLFQKIGDETHHRKRYDRYPRWGALGVCASDTTDRERKMFEALVARNALNMHSGRPWVGFVPRDASQALVQDVVTAGLQELRRPGSRDFPELPLFRYRADAVGVAPIADRPRHVVLWVGSAKPRGSSTSESLGRHLVSALERRGWTSETIHVARVVRLGRARRPTLVEAFRRADLVVLSAPVYIDCLPALVLDGLASLVGDDLGDSPPALLPIVQCGFPELTHTALAVEVASVAADTIGLRWAGHLAMGGGGMVDGAPLIELGGSVRNQLAALEAAAAELDEGRPVSEAVAQRFARTPMSPRVYRAVGQVGWIASALRHGSVLKLWDRPFETPPRRSE